MPGDIAGIGLVRVRAAVAVIHAVWEISRMEGITHEAEATDESGITDMDMTEPLAQERARIEREEALFDGFADSGRAERMAASMSVEGLSETMTDAEFTSTAVSMREAASSAYLCGQVEKVRLRRAAVQKKRKQKRQQVVQEEWSSIQAVNQSVKDGKAGNANTIKDTG